MQLPYEQGKISLVRTFLPTVLLVPVLFQATLLYFSLLQLYFYRSSASRPTFESPPNNGSASVW